MQRFNYRVFLFLLLNSASIIAGNPNTHLSTNKLITISDLEYQGAFRLPVQNFGISNLTYAEGQIAYNKSKNSIFIVGHKHHQAIAEFEVPELSKSNKINDLTMSKSPIQKFSSILNRVKDSAQNKTDTIGGLSLYNGKLIVNAYEYYDADGDNTQTTLIINNPNDLAGSDVSGFFDIQGKAHASGWISPIPSAWQKRLNGQWLTGSSSSMPIISRLSVGPSAFIFNPADLGIINPVPTTALLDFDLDNPLHNDFFNKTDNKLWNHLSRAVIGFIAPNTDTYVTLGFSGGHNSGVCYKCIPEGLLSECYGYCAKKASDYHLMYWLWDVNDLLSVKQGNSHPYEIRPYEYGIMNAPFPATKLGGGSFDLETGKLYITLQSADTEQTIYGAAPIIAVYRLNQSK